MRKAVRWLVVVLTVVAASASPIAVDCANACSSWTIITYYDETWTDVIGERTWSCSAGPDADGGWGETSHHSSVQMGFCYCGG